MQPRGERVVIRFGWPETFLHLGLSARHEGFPGLRFAGGGPQNFGSELRPTMQPPAKFVNMLRGTLHITKMREKQARRASRENGGERALPNLETDVRLRRGRQDVRPAVDANVRGVPDVNDSLRRVHSADIVSSMTL